MWHDSISKMNWSPRFKRSLHRTLRLEEISWLPQIICHCIFSRFVFMLVSHTRTEHKYQNPKVEIALSARLSASFNSECVKGLNNKIKKISIKLLFSNLKCVQCNSSNCRKGSHTIRKWGLLIACCFCYLFRLACSNTLLISSKLWIHIHSISTFCTDSDSF